MSINAEDIIYDLLSNIPGNFSIYELTAGSISTYNTSSNSSFDIRYPAYYLTNFTEYTMINISDFMPIGASNAIFLNKEEFAGGVVSVSFVMSGVVTSSWMLFLLLLLSSNTIPNSLILANSFHAICYTIILSKLTTILRRQICANVSDSVDIQKIVTYSIASIIIKSIATLFIYISWIDLLLQMNKYEKRKKLVIQGFSLSIISVAFQLAYGFLFRSDQHTSSVSFRAIKVLHFLLDILIILIFHIQTLRFSFRKKKFAYNRRAIPLAIFSWIMLLTPYSFIIIDIVSDSLRTWSAYVSMFSKLCVAVVMWEWLHTIKMLEIRHERKTVLGRRISNDSFASKLISDTSSQHYILKSLNIVAILSLLKSKLTFTYTKTPKDELVSLYEMDPVLSRQTTHRTSVDDDVSLVGEYPQFNVDHRYLRETPSTMRDTPMSQSRNE